MFYRLNRRPNLSLFDLKEKCTRYAGVPINKADLFDRHDHRVGQSKVVYYHTYLQSLTLFVEETQKPRYESGCDSPTSFYSHLTSSLSTNRRFVNRKSQNTANNNQILAAVIAHLHDATSDPIRVRIPYSNFLSPKTCRNLDKSSFKMGHTIEHTRLA